MAVLDPIRLKLHELGRGLRQRGASRAVPRAGASAAARARRRASSASDRELWIERDDFAEVPAKGSSASIPATGFASSTATSSSAPAARRTRAASSPRVLATRRARHASSGTPGADAVKVKGTLTWLAVDDALARRDASLRPPVQRARTPTPAAGTSRRACNPDSKQVVAASVERARSRRRSAAMRFQFERHGYFVADLVDHDPAKPVFNRIGGPARHLVSELSGRARTRLSSSPGSESRGEHSPVPRRRFRCQRASGQRSVARGSPPRSANSPALDRRGIERTTPR